MLAIRPGPRATESFGIGTQITVEYDGGVQIREVESAGGLHSHNAPGVHFGLGSVSSLNRITVRWPDRAVTVPSGPVAANAIYAIERPIQSLLSEGASSDR